MRCIELAYPAVINIFQTNHLSSDRFSNILQSAFPSLSFVFFPIYGLESDKIK